MRVCSVTCVTGYIHLSRHVTPVTHVTCHALSRFVTPCTGLPLEREILAARSDRHLIE